MNVYLNINKNRTEIIVAEIEDTKAMPITTS